MDTPTETLWTAVLIITNPTEDSVLTLRNPWHTRDRDGIWFLPYCDSTNFDYDGMAPVEGAAFVCKNILDLDVAISSIHPIGECSGFGYSDFYIYSLEHNTEVISDYFAQNKFCLCDIRPLPLMEKYLIHESLDSDHYKLLYEATDFIVKVRDTIRVVSNQNLALDLDELGYPDWLQPQCP